MAKKIKQLATNAKVKFGSLLNLVGQFTSPTPKVKKKKSSTKKEK